MNYYGDIDPHLREAGSVKLRSRGANYIESGERPRVRSIRSKLHSVVATLAVTATVLATVIAGALAADALTNKHVTAANAGLGLSCTSVIGGNMDERSPWGAGPFAPQLYEKASGRTFTLNEVVGTPAWTNYTGIGDGPESDFFVKKYSDVINSEGLNGGALDDGTGKGSSDSTAGTLPDKYSAIWGDVKDKLAHERNTGTCVWEQVFVTNIANGAGLGLANAAQTFVTWVSTNAFNSSFICDPNTPASGGCIDLVRVIGGTKDTTDGGLIGSLTDSIYKPLVLIVLVISALNVMYIGVIKRRFREAIYQTVWVTVSFIIGLALLLNPSLLARAPMIASNAVSGCVIGSFNGSNCFTGGGFKTSTDEGGVLKADKGVCVSDATGATTDQLTGLAVNSMGCTIWKTFILQNYAKGGFGTNLDQLDVKTPGTVAAKAVEKSGVNPDNFCYSLQTTGSFKDYDGKWLQTRGDGSKVCNLAVYNMLMQMDVTPYGKEASKVPAEYDPAWYDLITTVASSDKMWPIWTNGGQQFAQGIVAVISVVLAGIIITVTSILALMYYITAVILMIFAPLFILVGMNPGRGKRIMFGWLESILSSILKYLASAVFLLVSLALYSAVLGSADPMSALLFVTILSMVLWMYRKEIVDTFSKVNLGGERLANVLDKNIPIVGASARQLGDKAQKIPGAALGGALGGFMAGGLGKVGAGSKIALQNELRSAPGLVGRTAQAAERQMRDNMQDFGRDQTRAKEAAERAEAVATSTAEEANLQGERVSQLDHDRENAELDVNRSDQQINDAQEELDKANAERIKAGEHEETVKAEFDTEELKAALHTDALMNTSDAVINAGTVTPDYARFRETQMMIEQLGANIKLAEIQGDKKLAIELTSERDQLVSSGEDLRFRNTKTPELEQSWQEQQVEYDKQLDHELRSRPELVDHRGDPTAYSADEHVAAGQRVAYAEEATREADLNISVASSRLDGAELNSEASRERLKRREGELEEARTKAEEAQKLASDRRIDASATRANSDTMFTQYQDMGPGNMPTVRANEKLKKAAHGDAEYVRSMNENSERTKNGDDLPVTGVPTSPKPGAAADAANAETSAAQTAAMNDRAEAAERNRDAARVRLEEAKADQILKEREVNAKRNNLDQYQANFDMTQEYAKPYIEASEKLSNQAAMLSSAINDGTKLQTAEGKELTEAEMRALLEKVEEKIVDIHDNNAMRNHSKATDNLRTAKDLYDTSVTESGNADKAFRAAQEEMRKREAALEDREAKLNAAEKISNRDADRASRSSGALTLDQTSFNRRPRNASEAKTNRSLERLVDISGKLVGSGLDQSTIDGIQSQIRTIADNIERTPGASDSIIENLERSINSRLNGGNGNRGGGLPRSRNII